MPLTDPGHRVARSEKERDALLKQEGVTHVALVTDFPRAVYSKRTGRMAVAKDEKELADFKRRGWATTKDEIHKLLDARVAAERAEDDSPVEKDEEEGIEVGTPSKSKSKKESGKEN